MGIKSGEIITKDKLQFVSLGDYVQFDNNLIVNSSEGKWGKERHLRIYKIKKIEDEFITTDYDYGLMSIRFRYVGRTL